MARIQLKFDDELPPELQKYISQLKTPPKDRLAFWERMCDTIHAMFEEHGGNLPSAAPDPEIPGLFWYVFDARLHFVYQRIEDPPRPKKWWHIVGFLRRLLVQPSIKIVILEWKWSPR